MGWPRFAALVGRNKLSMGREETCGYLFPLSDQSTLDQSMCSPSSEFPSAIGSISRSPATHTYNVGNRKMFTTRSAINPPTITIANGRCESEPIACERAAGSSPRVATSIVIMMGRSLSTAPSTAAFSIEYLRARSWLVYSSIMTPVCTDTPKSARKPTPEDTLKFVPVIVTGQLLLAGSQY